MAKMRISPELKKTDRKIPLRKRYGRNVSLLRYISWWEKMKTYI